MRHLTYNSDRMVVEFDLRFDPEPNAAQTVAAVPDTLLAALLELAASAERSTVDAEGESDEESDG